MRVNFKLDSVFLSVCEALSNDRLRSFVLGFPNLVREVVVPICAHFFATNNRRKSVHEQELNPDQFGHQILVGEFPSGSVCFAKQRLSCPLSDGFTATV